MRLRGGFGVFTLVALTACGGRGLKGRDAGADAPRDVAANAGSDGPSGGGAGAGADAPAPGEDALAGDAGTDTLLPDGEGGVLSPLCNGYLPSTYVAECSGCHTANGPANPRYPDLFGYKGTIIEFASAVRAGGAQMVGLPPTIVSDGDLAAIYNYFTQQTRQGLETIGFGGVSPLFSTGDAKNPPVFFKRGDGVIVTRAAGRFRGRHEKEGSFGLYTSDSFSPDLSFGLTFEDFTPLGQQLIRVTYLPAYDITSGLVPTNFRHWKAEGNNATFLWNTYMVQVATPTVPATAPFRAVEQYDENMPPDNRKMAAGELYEVEFGAFLPPMARRSSFYTETFRYRIGVGGLTPENRDYAPLFGPLLPAQLGGDTTIAWLVAEPYMYFDQMALDIQHENVRSFLEGRRLFFTDFTTGEHLEMYNTPFLEQAGKAGPLLNAKSCETCHLRNGGGSMVKDLSTTAIKLVDAGPLGDQLQMQEGAATVSAWRTRTVFLADGQSIELRKPNLTVTAGGADVLRFSARVARPLVGLGLLEAVDERSILALADALDCDKNGISGRANIVKDPMTGVARIGRFGSKADKVSVTHQVAVEASANLGVTTTLLPDAQGKAELTDADLAKLTTYMRLIGVPPQRTADDLKVRTGAQLFQRIGCAACHRTDLLTSANHPFAELRGQAVRPFTDLLLHDMGANLADDSGIPAPTTADGPASASEWRTPPLWGIGLAKTVNPDAAFLHDGRAASVLEAILWHGGEAERAEVAFAALPAVEREALLAYLQSL